MIDHHSGIPKELKANLTCRKKLLELCKDNPEAHSLVIKMCREDILFYIGLMVFQYNPDKDDGDEVGPFIPWEAQEKFILRVIDCWIMKRKDHLCEKSRKIGATWMALIIEDWRCNFFDRKKFICISHSKDAVVIAGDSDTLFWKIDFIHEHLPSWMTSDIDHEKQTVFRYGRTNSIITGAASTGRSGVGGRGHVMLDEVGKMEKAESIIGQTADTGPRLFISTHYGVGTAFYELTRRTDLDKTVIHWSDHPEYSKGLYFSNKQMNRADIIDKTYEFPPDYQFVCDGTPEGPYAGIRSPWYDNEVKRRKNNRDVAAHLDIHPEGADTQFFNMPLIRDLMDQYCCAPTWKGELEYDNRMRPVNLVREGERMKRYGRPDDYVAQGFLKFWFYPKGELEMPEGKYTIGADVAMGSGATRSCLSVVDAATGDKVAEYTDPKIGEADFARLSAAICYMFHDAFFCWDKTGGPGAAFGTEFMLWHTNIYYRINERPDTKNPTVSDSPGWSGNNPKDRYTLLEKYQEALGRHQFINHSMDAMKEMANFKVNASGVVEHANIASKNDPSGARELHGDMVIADAIAWKMVAFLDLLKIREFTTKQIVPRGSFLWRMKERERLRREEEWG